MTGGSNVTPFIGASPGTSGLPNVPTCCVLLGIGRMEDDFENTL